MFPSVLSSWFTYLLGFVFDGLREMFYPTWNVHHSVLRTPGEAESQGLAMSLSAQATLCGDLHIGWRMEGQ